MKISLICNFFDLIAETSEIYKIPKWTQFWHEMLKIASFISLDNSDIVFPLQAPLVQFCGADELGILLYTLSSPNLCFRAFCYFMNPASNKYFIHLLFFRFDC